LLIKNKDTLIEIPLSTEDWSRERLDDELTSLEIRFDQFSKIFDALSHETRLRMMKHILEAEDQTTSFAEFMRDLDLNPKLVWENTRKLHDGGLVEKVEKGRYRCSEFGRMEFMMNLAIRRLMEALEGLES
jgi:predicted transcriptional regulator